MISKLGTAALALAVGGVALTSAPAQAAPALERRGTTSLAEVLAADGVKFDRKAGDFDIVEAAAYAVLNAKPDSPVALLADGKTRLTVFAPTDQAFRDLVKDLTGKRVGKEKKVFAAVASLGIDTVEDVLLYHVVPGATLTAKKVMASDGAKLETALGKKVKVRITSKGVFLKDKDRDDTDPQVIVTDLNKGNRQIAHAIDAVLRPADL